MDDMLDLQVARFVADEVQLADMCEKLDHRGEEIEWREAQICFANAEARWETMQEYDAMREAILAEKRLCALFMGEWPPCSLMSRAYSEYRKRLLYHHRHES